MTDVYLDEGEIDLALKSVRQRRPGFFYGADQLIRVAQAASETCPHSALDIYRQQAESLIEARGRGNYQRACEHLIQARDLYRQLSQEPAWTGYIAELRERHRRLSALKEELSNAGTVTCASARNVGAWRLAAAVEGIGSHLGAGHWA